MNPVDQVFMDEIKRKSYQRALTDDFSIVDVVSNMVKKESAIDDEEE